jgi:hypothetical protein
VFHRNAGFVMPASRLLRSIFENNSLPESKPGKVFAIGYLGFLLSIV